MSYKKKYSSICGATGLITAPHYMAERIIKRRVEKKGLTLPDRIWSYKFKNSLQYKYWHNAYFGQLTHACNILKHFDEDCVIAAFDSNECKDILSVTNSKLERVTRDKQKAKAIKEATKEKVSLTIVNANKTGNIKLKKTKSKIGKLK